MHSHYYRYRRCTVSFEDPRSRYGREGVVDTHEGAMLYKFFADKEAALRSLAVIVVAFGFDKRFNTALYLLL